MALVRPVQFRPQSLLPSKSSQILPMLLSPSQMLLVLPKTNLVSKAQPVSHLLLIARLYLLLKVLQLSSLVL
jgi:hypothetical protein